MQSDGGRCFIQVEAAVVRMRTMRRPDENYSDVILRLIEIEAGQASLRQSNTPSSQQRLMGYGDLLD
jgi:hypothetical protein